MSTHPFRQVDVFGNGPFSGNPVAVILGADDLTTEQMVRISEWTNLSECTFVLAPTDPAADYRVRIFSLSTELPFAGHPTLGTARAWLDAGGRPRIAGRVVQECGVGLVPLHHDGESLAFAAPELLRSGPVDEAFVAEVCNVLGITADDVVDAAWVDNGPGWVGLLLKDAEAVQALRPSAPPSGRWDIGVAGLHPASAELSLEVRAFFCHDGGVLREDPVTGSLNASLAQWLTSTGRIATPYVARQGTALGRDGRIRVAASDHDLWIGGDTQVAVSGTIEV
ncbi:PhzF family phenazine biosynthesis protein [Demequina capsici]|uniref:PhzF family phenazine biosynthesis protein n=1 Tax=Demequina capsici TaxID=3075620 RepID=A0AA96FBU2_9MICO|nr:PhzF family phenazine biosynthesis protein [Demequina sp. PMTSA13]WNM26552.1 PhzF family phenazine biosynthesis protein [Demequina sp. PMTSA13]